MGLSLTALIARMRENEPLPPWSVMTGLVLWLAYLVSRIVALGVISVLVDAEAAALGILSPVTTNLAMIAAALITVGLIILVVRRASPEEAVGAVLRLQKPRGSVLLLIIVALGAAILIDFVELIAQLIILPVNLQGLATAGMAGWLLAGAYTVVFGPLVETLLLQGILYPALAANRDNLLALFYTALMFTLLRVFDNPFSAVLWVESLLTGVFIGVVRAQQKSTRAALIAAMMVGVFTFYKALRLLL